MDISSIILHIESLIFASDRPLTSLEITDLINQAFGFMEDKITPEQIDAAMNGIIEKYSSEFYPFEIRQSGGGWQFLTKKEFHKTVAQLNGEKFLKRLSPAALETLAIIAYKAPITKGEIESIRGVSSDYSIQKLLEKELIVITGRNEKLPGHPLVYATSKNFMDYFGINSPEDLPRIKEVLSEQVIPTPVHPEVEQSETFIVSNDGELLERNENDADALDGHDLKLDETAGEERAAGEEGRLFIDESFDAPQNSTNGTDSLHPEDQSEEGESDDEEELGDADFELTDDGYGDSDDDSSEEILEEMDLTFDVADEDEDDEEAEDHENDDDDEDEEDADDMEGIEEEERELAEEDAAEDEDDQIISDEDEEDEEDDEENGKPNHPKA